MKGPTLAMAVGLLALVTTAEAQQPPARNSKKVESLDSHISLGQLTPTPEMWFYDQAARRYADPKNSIRDKAGFEAAQRQRRLAAQRWYGISNARPAANVTPFIGPYAPTWVSNTANPLQWSGGGNVILYSALRDRTNPW